jgi:hypothetical protein
MGPLRRTGLVAQRTVTQGARRKDAKGDASILRVFHAAQREFVFLCNVGYMTQYPECGVYYLIGHPE